MRNLIRIIAILSLLMIFWVGTSHAVMGLLEDEAKTWGNTNGFAVGPTKKGTEGCLKDKRFIAMTKDGVTLYAIFYHPVYEEETGLISQAMFVFDPPTNEATVQKYAVMLAPIMGTRGPTHTQSIKPNASDACLPKYGGKDKRWTQDWIREEHYGPGGKGIQTLRLYNDYIR